MPSVQKTIDVRVPQRTAYNQWTQFESFPEFMSGVEEVKQLDDKRLHWKASLWGKTEEWDAEITEQAPDMRIAWRSTSGAHHAGVVRFHHVSPTVTRVSLMMDYEPQGVVETVGDRLGFVSRQVEEDLGKFKEFIESRGEETGA
jgi:uncharacterized membrane protein